METRALIDKVFGGATHIQDLFKSLVIVLTVLFTLTASKEVWCLPNP